MNYHEFQSNVLDLVRTEVDREVREDAGQNEDHAGRIAEYRAAVRDSRYQMQPGDAYCAAFVSFILEKAGRPIRHDHGEGISYVPWLKELAEKQGAWSTSDEDVRPGDLILFSFGGDRPDHVGIIEGTWVSPDGELGVYTVEGNVGRFPNGGVLPQQHSLEMGSVLGFVDVWALTGSY